ncbi:MAG TPA: NUDIX domain-containing protein [Armatimonadota bacterium]|nr:NUDIX domain-containing protein [Armatimonadota bacterium]
MTGRHSGGESQVAMLRSAGGVVVKGRGDELRVAVMQSRYGTWVFPKGGFEPGESAEQTARREIREEIGLSHLICKGSLGWTEHTFERDRRRFRKRIDWFLFEAPGDAEASANPRENALDCGWFAPQQALPLLSHADQRRILRRALSTAG